MLMLMMITAAKATKNILIAAAITKLFIYLFASNH